MNPLLTIDREIAEMVGWTNLEPVDWVDIEADNLIIRWKGLPPNGQHRILAPEYHTNIEAQLVICKNRGWDITFHFATFPYSPGGNYTVTIHTSQNHRYGATHHESYAIAGAGAIHRALKEEK